MKTSLLENLLEFYREDPDDPFNVYALALEYQKYDTNESKKFFHILLENFPDYLPTYYVAAQFFLSIEEIKTAEKVLIKGIQLALDQQNTKSHQELIRAFRALEDEQMEW